MKTTLKSLFITLLVLSINGCADMTRMQKALTASAVCGASGAGIGALLGGGKGAAIGGLSGATLCGMLTYALASDPYTQSAAQQSESWEQDVGAKPVLVKAPVVVEDGEKRQRIDVQKMLLSDDQVVSGGRLSPDVKNHLRTAKNEARKVGGQVLVICPKSASPSVIRDIRNTGVDVEQDRSLTSGYVLVLSRNRADGIPV